MAGGFATRLEPIGEFIPKALLTLNGKPLIDYIINDLEGIEAVDRILISTNKKFEDQFDYWMKLRTAAGFKKKMTLIVEPAIHNGQKLGAVKGIAHAIKEARMKDDALIIFGDNFYTFDMGMLMEDLSVSDKIQRPGLIAYDIGSLENAKRFGVVKEAGGRVTDIEEKPQNPASSLVSTGIYFFPKTAIGHFAKYVRSGGNTDGMGFFLKWLTTQMEVQAVVPTKGEWFDIGTLDGYKEVFYKQKGYKQK